MPARAAGILVVIMYNPILLSKRQSALAIKPPGNPDGQGLNGFTLEEILPFYVRRTLYWQLALPAAGNALFLEPSRAMNAI